MTNLVIFAGRVGGRFLDNVKYLYLHCVRHKQPFSFAFLTHYEPEHRQLRKLGLPALLFPSDEALALLPRARVVVADDFWWKTQTPAYHLLTKAKTVQIWHGIPLKLIGFPEMESGMNMSEDKLQHLTFGYSGYDAAVSTSPYVTATALGRVFKAKTIWETGYPRNDVLLRETDELDLLGVDLLALKKVVQLHAMGYKIVFYMPTFRDTGGDAFNDRALDISALEQFGRRHKIAFLLKFHPYIRFEANLELKTVHLVDSATDAYPLLQHADCLLTDYSSIAYDFLLTGRPQVFFPYDLEKYLAQDRGMFYPYETMAPGPRPKTQENLFATLKAVLLDGKDRYQIQRSDLRTKLFTHHDAAAADRLASHIVSAFFSGNGKDIA